MLSGLWGVLKHSPSSIPDSVTKMKHGEASGPEADGNKPVRLEICTGQRQNDYGSEKDCKRDRSSSVLEAKLDELRKEISSGDGGIFPHAVLSAQHISLLSIHKPTSISQLVKVIGKVKAEKYGNKIAELIRNYVEAGQTSDEPNNAEPNDADKFRENERITKRSRKNEAHVIIQSSDDEND
ncbi:Mediator of RNA polymerase II transcription subunit 34 [Platanthera guangdongensis]|uniref:Mediator of RNA polymerase II transcription subunit 34 n=1 Tax=Platanthera guangdongensis TaxID=2320717 RepID=A0ABR2M286_9ASPA